MSWKLYFPKDVGVKSPNYDAYGLFRALHSHWHHDIKNARIQKKSWQINSIFFY